MSHNCETCGAPVKVVGKTTMHYEFDIDRILPSEENIKNNFIDVKENDGTYSTYVDIDFIRDFISKRLGGL